MDSIAHIDKERFYNALKNYQSTADHERPGSIGTLGEKSLHAVLKWYYEPDGSRHETAVGSHVADIVGEDGVIEIQTRSLSSLKPKLRELTELCRVTVVHPIIAEKKVISIDGATGEVLSTRNSPKHGSVYTEIREIYALREMLAHENLTLRLPVLTADEYRTFGVKTNRRKKQRTRRGEYVSDMLPTDIIDEIALAQSSDYAILLPEGLPDEFTADRFARAASTSEANARMAINLLVLMGLAVRTGKEGRRLKFTAASGSK